MIDRYAITPRPLTVEEGGGWLAEGPELPGCLSDGDDRWPAIRDAVRKSGVPISHQTVRQVLARPEAVP